MFKKRNNLKKILLGLSLALALLFSFLTVSGDDEPQVSQGTCTELNWSTVYGFVQNSTYGLANSANVTFYAFSQAAGGPPTYTNHNSTLTNSSGTFHIVINGSCSRQWKIGVIFYNASSGNALEIGPILPPLPKVAVDELNGSTLYLQPAATINLSARNSSGTALPFSYIVFDDTLGFPIAEKMTQLVDYDTVVVPRNRNYTIILMRFPDFVGGFDNQSTPPLFYNLRNISLYNLSQHVIEVNKSLAFNEINITGYINVSGNTSFVNVTQAIIRFFGGSMVPENAKLSLPNSVQFSYDIDNLYPGVSGAPIARYRITLMGASDPGISQLVEFYGNSSSKYYAWFQNFTALTSNITDFNITLMELAGNYGTTSDINTSVVTISLQDDTGAAMSSMHAELQIDSYGTNYTGANPPRSIPQLKYMVDSLSSGAFKKPIIAGSNVTLQIFSQQYAPVKKKINLTYASNGTIYIQLKKFDPKMMHGNGTREEFASEKGRIRIRFMKNVEECNQFNVSVNDCRIGSSDFDASFNPLQAMLAGKSNVRIELNNGSGTILYFIGVDLLASGPPDGMMSNDEAVDNVQSGGAVQQMWKFGSAAPDIYDKVLIGIPYNASRVNEYGQMNITLKYLYDADSNLQWNSTLDQDAAHLPSHWSDFNISWFNASAGGVACQRDNPNASTTNCYINTTTNYLWLNIKHFDGEDPELSGQSPQLPINVLIPLNATYYSSVNVSLNYTIANNTQISYWWYSNYSGAVNSTPETEVRNTTINLSVDGIHNVTVYVNDTSNNVNLTTIYFYVDTTPPNISFSNIANNSNFSSTTIWINGTASDNTSAGFGIGVNYTWINDSRWNNTGTNTSFAFMNVSAVAEGNYTVNISSNDSFGHVMSITINFSVDRTPPTTNASLMYVNDTNNDGNIEVNWTADPGERAATYRIYRYSGAIISINSTNIDSASLVYTTASNAVTFEDNTSIANNATPYSYVIVTVDSAGNANTSVVSNTKNLTANDTIKPKQTAGLTITGSGATATLTWLNITRDVSGNAEVRGVWYKLYRGTSVNLSAANVSDPTSGLTFLKNVSANTTTDTITSTAVYQYVITAVDDAGNENLSLNSTVTGNYGNVSLTYTASSSSGSSGGGGGGGATTGDSTGASYSHMWTSMPTGSTTMTITKDVIAFTKLIITTTAASADVEIVVTKLDSKPTAAEVGKTVYQYVEINKKNLENAVISKAKIEFKVEKKWLTDNNATADRVVLTRYNSKWEELPTTRLSTADELYYHYSAESPGFSYFAIAIKAAGADETGGNATQPEEEQPKNESQQDQQEQVSVISKGWTRKAIIGGAVMVVLGVAGFMFYKRRGTGKPKQTKLNV